MRNKIHSIFLAILFSALALHAQAQQPGRIYRLGILSRFAGPSPDIDAFRQGLRDLGYVEGKNLLIEYRYAEGRSSRYPELASDLVRLNVDLIIANGTEPTTVAKQATSTIPIVMTSSTDPERTGLISSLAQPGGNVTGLTESSGPLAGKMLELFKEIIPKLSRLAVVIPISSQAGVPGGASKVFLTEIETAAKELSVQIMPLGVRPDGYEATVVAAKKERANALFSRLPPGTPFDRRKQLMESATKNGLPVGSGQNLDTEAGGIMSYGWDRRDLYRRAATYVDKILKGAKPGNLPVERPTKIELVVNLKSAREIGVIIPQRVLLKANRVIK
jgi:putative tryptophan/tyrosine transport system substrate-binding protein